MDWVYFLIKFIVAFLIVNVILVVVAFLVYLERKVAAHMQARMGPNRAGPIGLLQSFADLIKMLKKEDTIPAGADKIVFWIAPLVAVLAALGMMAVIPFGPAANQPGHIDIFQPIDWFASDVGVSALVVLALSSLGVYGFIMAGWSSNSKYPLLGGLRSSSQVISYEIALGISLVGVFLLSGSLSLASIASAQHPTLHAPGAPGFWFVFLQPVAFIVFLTSAIAESSRAPFDLPEAESELVGGYHTEYSSTRFLLFQTGEYVGMLSMTALTVACFLGAWVSPFAAFIDGTDIPFVSGLLGSGPHWFVLKMGILVFVIYWLRWTLPRFRYDQLMGLCWKVFLPLTIANILIIAVLKLIFFPPTASGVPSPADNWLYWLIMVVIELALGALAIYGLSSVAGIGWFGKAERPVLVDRSIILVRTAHGGRGTIEGEARAVSVERKGSA